MIKIKWLPQKNISMLIKITISLLILSIIFYKIGIGNIYTRLISNSPIIIFTIILLLLINFLIDAFNFLLLLKALKVKIKYLKIFTYVLITAVFGALIPGKMGQFVMAYYLKKEKIKMGKSLAIIIIDKIISLIVLISIAIFAIFSLFKDITNISIIIILLILILLIIFVISAKKIKQLIVGKLSYRFRDNLKGLSNNFFILFKKHKKYLIINFILTVIKSFITGYQLYFYLHLNNKTIELIKIVYVNAITSLSTFIPITISGLGLREGTGIFLLKHLGIDSQLSIGFYIIWIFVYYSFALGLYLLLSQYKKNN